jgi:hypothetical protein
MKMLNAAEVAEAPEAPKPRQFNMTNKILKT